MVSPAGSRSFTSKVGRYCGRSVVLAIVSATTTGTGASAGAAGAAPAVVFVAFVPFARGRFRGCNRGNRFEATRHGEGRGLEPDEPRAGERTADVLVDDAQRGHLLQNRSVEVKERGRRENDEE